MHIRNLEKIHSCQLHDSTTKSVKDRVRVVSVYKIIHTSFREVAKTFKISHKSKRKDISESL